MGCQHKSLGAPSRVLRLKCVLTRQARYDIIHSSIRFMGGIARTFKRSRISTVQMSPLRPFPDGTKRLFSPYYRVIRRFGFLFAYPWFSTASIFGGRDTKSLLDSPRHPKSSLKYVVAPTRYAAPLFYRCFVKSDAPENVCCRTLSQRAVCKAEFYDVRKTSFPIESIILTATVRINARKERERRLVC